MHEADSAMTGLLASGAPTADLSALLEADEDGMTALHHAARKGHMDAMRLFVSARMEADVSATDKEGRTALHWAARNGHLNCARHLIAAQASVANSANTPR